MKWSVIWFGFMLISTALADDSGRFIYERKCFGCHSPETNRIGPRHRGLFDRSIAGVEDYEYSAALTELGENGKKWDAKSLDLWLQNPAAYAPGTKMASRVLSADDRRKIIQYLKTM